MLILPIQDHPGYVAGENGHIYSMWKAGKRSLIMPDVQRQLKEQLRPKDGRLFVVLKGNKPRLVHRLVAGSFHGPCPPGLECSHVDGDPSHNWPSNLVWETHAENERRKREHGTFLGGTAHPNSRLTESDLVEIREALRRGDEFHREIALRYGVSASTIGNIARNKHYVIEEEVR